MLKNDRYTYRITWSEEDQEYAGLCVEFPSLSWLDKNPEAALAGIRNMVAEAVEDMKANQETPPEPITSRRFSGKFMVRIPPELHRRLVMEAQEEGISLNRLASDKLSRQDG
jgi:predicted HicB family RNase H-like nuclease